MRIFISVLSALFIAAVLVLAGDSAARAQQPVSLWLPWEGGSLWTYTHGPHGNQLEALDFQPADAGGQPCEGFISSFWVTASADGTVTTRANGVEIDHGEGFGTGYYHLGNVQVADGQQVVAGERLGNPGCCPDGPVGGCWATGPHLHFYTTYRGVRQPIAGTNLGGWFVRGDGCLDRAGQQVCAHSRIVSNTPDPVDGGGRADIVVLLDTSRSASVGPDDTGRRDTANALLQAARDDDRVSIIHFRDRVNVMASLTPVAPDGALDPVLADAAVIDEKFARTDIRQALIAACREHLLHGESSARAVVIVSAGRDLTGRAGTAEDCLQRHGIPVFAYRLGDSPSPLLERIAETTGGTHKPLTDVRNLYCEFRQVRATVSGNPPGHCSALRIEPGDILSLPFPVPAGQDGATLEIRWRHRAIAEGADDPAVSLNATILGPTRRPLPMPFPGIEAAENSGSIAFHIVRPLSGTWSLTVSSDAIPEGGLYVTFAGATIPQAPPPTPQPEPSPGPSEEPTPPPSETPVEASPTDVPTDTPTPTPATTPDEDTPTPEPQPTAAPTEPPADPTPEPTRLQLS